MKRLCASPILLVGRSVISGPPQNGKMGAMPVRTSERGFQTKLEEQRAWREAEDAALEEENQKRFNSNPKVPATHKYNLNVNANGYGMKRRLRVVRNSDGIDPKDFQTSLDQSQLTMNFK